MDTLRDVVLFFFKENRGILFPSVNGPFDIQSFNLVFFGCRIRSPWKEISNLHFLWDAAGGLYLTEWPLVQEEPWQNKIPLIVKDSSTAGGFQ